MARIKLNFEVNTEGEDAPAVIAALMSCFGGGRGSSVPLTCALPSAVETDSTPGTGYRLPVVKPAPVAVQEPEPEPEEEEEPELDEDEPATAQVQPIRLPVAKLAPVPVEEPRKRAKRGEGAPRRRRAGADQPQLAPPPQLDGADLADPPRLAEEGEGETEEGGEAPANKSDSANPEWD